MPVNTQHKEYEEMYQKWQRLRDCYGGRDAVIKAANKYVPDLPGGDTAMNASYRARGNFFNALKRTVEGMVGAIFQEAPEVEFPDTFKEYLDDITLTNVPFEMFSAEVARELMLVARYGVMVDMPAPGPSGPIPGARPYCVGYKAEDIISWRTERINGIETLTQVVVREHVELPSEKDPFTNDCQEQYRAMVLGENGCIVTLYREDPNNRGKFILFGTPVALTRKGQPLMFIPFIFLGALTASADVETPPLTDLADVNLAHWRNSVDHEWGLHLVALPTPWVAGVKGASTGPMKIGPSVVWELEVQGQAGMLEFGGQGLGALVTAMTNKEKQMAVLGARLLEQEAQVRETASAVRMRHSDEHANLRTVAQSMEVGLTLVLQALAWWAGTDETTVEVAANVELNKEYLNVKADPQEIQVALTALQAGEISFETWWNLISTGGWGREGIDAAAERKAINEQKALAPEPPVDPNLSPDDPAATGDPKPVIPGRAQYQIGGGQ